MGEDQVKVEYDRDADILYIKLKDSKIVDTRMLGEEVYVDVDVDKNFVGIEIWKASQNVILPISREIAEEVTVDLKGRIQIPKAIRDKVGLHVGGKARLKIEKETIVIMPPISPEEFIKEMEGCIKEGAPVMDPLNLKKMWEPTEK